MDGINLDGIMEKAAPALQVIMVYLSYLVDFLKKGMGLFSFATGITSYDD